MSLDNFCPEECSLARKIWQRTGGAYIDGQNWQALVRPVDAYVASLAQPTGLTGESDRSDRSKQVRVQLEIFIALNLVIGFLAG